MDKMKYYLKRIFCHVFIFFFSGTVYYTMEILFKTTHSSHWTMFVPLLVLVYFLLMD